MTNARPSQQLPLNSSSPVAWVTGSGAARVGRVIAEHFAHRGYRLALHANHSIDEATQCAAEWTEQGFESMVTAGPVEESNTAARAVQQIINRFGRLDVLVNSAAVWDWQSLEETTAADVRRQFDVNTLGSFLCSREAGLHMVKQPTGGAILLIGDWAVSRPYRDFSAYFIGKGAIETMVRTLAIELATRNPAIRVNAILPGPVLFADSISQEKAELIRQESLLKRHGTPQHVAEAAIFLAEHQFITGVCLNVDGGRSIYAGPSGDAVAHPTFNASADVSPK